MISHHKALGAQDPVRVSSAQDFSLHCWPKLGFVFTQRCFDLKCLRWLSCFILDSQVYPYQVSSLDSKFCPVNWTVDLEINCIREKSQLWSIYSQTSWILTHINIMSSYEPFDQVWTIIQQENWSEHHKCKMVIFRVLTV